MTLKEKIIISTFSLFLIEAIVHYNLGKEDEQKKIAKTGFIPPPESIIKLGLVLGAFSILNGILVETWEKS